MKLNCKGGNELGFHRPSRRRPCTPLYTEGAGYNGNYTLDKVKPSLTGGVLLLLRWRCHVWSCVVGVYPAEISGSCLGTKHYGHAWRRDTVATVTAAILHVLVPLTLPCLG